jgi:membrane protein implicated in regulation of membrane protease activity
MVIFLTICAVGFAILLVSLLLGEIADHGGEILHDIGGDHDALETSGPSFFSLRMLASFVTGFGGAGAIGRHLDLSYVVSSALGLGGGLAIAGLVYLVVSFVYKQQASSTVVVSELVGKTAKVSITIPAGGVGQVTLPAKGSTMTVMARSQDGAEIEYGAVVVVKEVVGDQITVARQS